MKAKQLGLLSTAVAIVVAFAVYDYVREQNEESEKNESQKLFSLAKEGILGISITGKYDTVVLSKEDSGWKVEQPIEDSADEAAVDDLLNELADSKMKDVVSTNRSDLAVYGLDKPIGEIRLSMSGREQALSISSKKNFEGDIYVKYSDRPEVMTASGLLAARLEKKAFDYRDRRLFRGAVSEIEEIQFRGRKDRFSIVSQDATWVAKQDPKLKLDQNKVRNLVEDLGDLRASDYLEEGVLDKNPKATIILIRNDQTQWTADFFESNKVFSAKASEPKQFIKLNPYEAAKFIDTTLDSLRDRAEAFQFDRNDVSFVQLTTLTQEMIGIDQERARNIVGLLRNAEVDQFLSDIKIEKPVLSIVLLNSEKQEIYSLKVAQGSQGRFVAQSSSYADPFTVSKEFVESVKKETNEKN